MQLIHEVTLVGAREKFGLVHHNRNRWRARRNLAHIEDLRLRAQLRTRTAIFKNGANDRVEATRGLAVIRLFVEIRADINHARHAFAGGRGEEHHRRKVERKEFLGDVLDIIAGLQFCFNEIPFIDRDDGRLMLLDQFKRETLLNLRGRLCRIKQQHADIGASDRGLRALMRVVLDVIGPTLALAHACRVDRDEGAAVEFEAHIDGIPRSSRDFRHNHARLTSERIDERALTCVAATHNRDLHFWRRSWFNAVWQAIPHRFKKRALTERARRARHHRLAETKTRRILRRSDPTVIVNFIRN